MPFSAPKLGSLLFEPSLCCFLLTCLITAGGGAVRAGLKGRSQEVCCCCCFLAVRLGAVFLIPEPQCFLLSSEDVSVSAWHPGARPMLWPSLTGPPPTGLLPYPGMHGCLSGGCAFVWLPWETSAHLYWGSAMWTLSLREGTEQGGPPPAGSPRWDSPSNVIDPAVGQAGAVMGSCRQMHPATCGVRSDWLELLWGVGRAWGLDLSAGCPVADCRPKQQMLTVSVLEAGSLRLRW